MPVRAPFLTVLTLGCVLEFGYAAVISPHPQIQLEDRAWEINAGHLQAVGLHMPPDKPRVGDLMLYQVKLSTHQELTIEWTLIPGKDHPVRREEVTEGSLAANFILSDRKQNIPGSARTSTLTLSDLALVVAAITGQGEIRGLTVGPGSPLIRPESLRGARPGYYLVYPKEVFQIFLPDDPKIEKLVFLLAHPDGPKYCLEQVGTLELKPKAATK